jgi:hypothetical protein
VVVLVFWVVLLVLAVVVLFTLVQEQLTLVVVEVLLQAVLVETVDQVSLLFATQVLLYLLEPLDLHHLLQP